MDGGDERGHSMTGTSAAPVLGYCDSLSVRPGDRVRFRVGAGGADEVAYSADFVRLRCADVQPEGPGFRAEEVGRAIAGVLVARAQRIDRGSRAVVPAAGLLGDLQSFSVQAVVWPTRPGQGRQSIVATWDEKDRGGFALFLDEDGAPGLLLGDGSGEVAELSTGCALAERRWVRLSASYDAESGRARIRQEPLTDAAGDLLASQVRTRDASLVRGLSPRASRPLTFAAWRDGADTRGPRYAAHFDGKLEAPRIARGALGDDALREVAASTPPSSLGDVIVGFWDFSRDIGGRRIVDLSGQRLEGRLENLPVRAVTGVHWDGTEFDWKRAPEQYAAIHFHADDLYDAGWEDAFELEVPADWRSGIYAARLRSEDGTDYVPFFVCPPKGRAVADIAFLAPTLTYLAYANLPDPQSFAASMNGEFTELPEDLMHASTEFGGSCYQQHEDGSGIHHSSHLRPVLTLKPRHDLWGWNADTLITDWLEASDLDYDVITDHLLHEEGPELLDRYRVVVTGTHPEYYTTRMLDAVEAHLGRGGRLVYMGGNGFYWRVGLSEDWPAALELRRAEDGTRTWESPPGEYYQAWGGELGGLWRRIGRAPNRLVGVGFVAQGFTRGAPYVRQPEADDPRASFVLDGVDSAVFGDFGRLGGAAAEEIDRANLDLGTPTHALVLASANGFTEDMLKTKEEFLMTLPHNASDPDIRADLVFFETRGGGAVFSTGSIGWAGSLAHDGYANDVSRITRNVMRRFLDPKPFAAAIAGE